MIHVAFYSTYTAKLAEGDFADTACVFDLKMYVAEIKRYNMDDYNIIFRGKILTDQVLLSMLNITEDAKFYVRLKNPENLTNAAIVIQKIQELMEIMISTVNPANINQIKKYVDSLQYLSDAYEKEFRQAFLTASIPITEAEKNTMHANWVEHSEFPFRPKPAPAGALCTTSRGDDDDDVDRNDGFDRKDTDEDDGFYLPPATSITSNYWKRQATTQHSVSMTYVDEFGVPCQPLDNADKPRDGGGIDSSRYASATEEIKQLFGSDEGKQHPMLPPPPEHSLTIIYINAATNKLEEVQLNYKPLLPIKSISGAIELFTGIKIDNQICHYMGMEMDTNITFVEYQIDDTAKIIVKSK